MKYPIPVLQIALLSIFFCVVPTSLKAGDTDWEYPAVGRGLNGETSAGKAGQFRRFSSITTDPIEKVVIWYAERLGLPKDETLVRLARKGFANLEQDQSIGTGAGHDTNDRQDHTLVLAALTTKISHITFLHIPDLEGTKNVTISLTASSGVTSIMVIRPTENATEPPATAGESQQPSLLRPLSPFFAEGDR